MAMYFNSPELGNIYIDNIFKVHLLSRFHKRLDSFSKPR